MQRLTARFHLRLQMSTNELFGMKVSEGINQPQLPNKPIIIPL